MARTAIIHKTTLTPSKDELINAWLTRQNTSDEPKSFTREASFRFVDSEGNVGIEFLLGRDEQGRLIQFPLTYRSEQIQGLIGITEHGVLGTRYAHLATHDPVAVQEFLRVIAEEDVEAEFSTGDPKQATAVGIAEGFTQQNAKLMESTSTYTTLEDGTTLHLPRFLNEVSTQRPRIVGTLANSPTQTWEFAYLSPSE